MNRPAGLLALSLLLSSTLLFGQTPIPFERLPVQLTIAAEGGAYSLARPRSALLVSSGDVFVIESSDATILKFGPDGRWRGAFGRRGGGPGEFRDPSSLLLHGDSVVIWDPGLSRLTVMTADGKMVRTVPVRAPGVAGLMPSGQLFTVSTREYGGTGEFAMQWFHVIARDTLGRVADTLFSQHRPYRSLRIVRSGGGVIVGAQPFDDGPLSAVSRDGRSVAWISRRVDANGQFDVAVSALGGGQRYSRSISYTPLLVTREVLQAAIGRLISPGVTNTEVAAALHVPATRPTVTLAYFLSDGGLVLRREETFGGPIRHSILDPRGNEVATLLLPAHVSIASGTSSQLLFSIRSPEGLVSYQLSPVP